MPEDTGRVAPTMTETVERLDAPRLSLARCDAGDRVHGPRLDLEPAPRVGYDGVLRGPLREQDGLGHLLEQVHHGGTSEAERPRGNPELQDLAAFGALERRDDEEQLGTGSGAKCTQRLGDTRHIHELELLREGEQLLQQRE